VSAEVEDGLWCKRCKQRHGYATLRFNVQRRQEHWYMIWSCPNFFDVLKEVKLGDSPRETVDVRPAEPDDET